MTPEQIAQAFGEVARAKPMIALAFLIGANLALGVMDALKDGKFTFAELADILKKVLYYVLPGPLVLGTTGQLMEGTAGNILSILGTALGLLPFSCGVGK